VALRRSLVGFLVHSSILAQSGVITTIAGRTPVNGAPVRGFDGDGGPALAAALSLANFQNTCDPNRFEQTSHIAVDAKSNIYFTDSNGQRIRRIDPSGVITTIAGTGDQPGPACQAPGPVNDGGKALAARLFNPADVVVHPNGSLLIADQQNNRIRQITASGTISTIAGSGSHNLYAPGIPATTSPMDWPSSLVIDANGLIYFAEEHSNRIGKIGADGKLSTVVDLDPTKFTATLNKPMGIAFDRNGGLLIADTGNHRIRRVDPSGAITTIAGSGREAFCGDGGPAINACFDTPMDVKADALGNIFVADTGNNRVRRIDPSGTITTVAGTGIPGRGADGIAATASALNFPCALALDADGSLYIVDWQNYLIRKVTFAAAPSIAAGGIVNGASFTSAVAPGSLISIFGTSLSGASAVEVNGTAVPLIAVTPGQINAQLPYETAAGAATAVVVTPAGRSAAATFTVSPIACGVFAYAGSDRAIAANQDNSLNSPAIPESRGRAIVLYMTGLGAVSPAVGTGQTAPPDALSSAAATVHATVGGVPATVLFAGLTPGFIGLGQVNVLVPDGAPTGDAVPVILESSGQTSKTVTVSIR
jgi:uncharacterized protein (TIGR03437 family)